MPLTPEDVRNKQFSTVRLREGYEMDEVDAFLDEVEAELTRLGRDNEDLRTRVAAAGRQVAAPTGPPAEAIVAAPPAPPSAPPAPPQAPAAAPAAAAPAPTDSAVRMLELAQKTADEHVANAKGEASRIIADARAQAERVTGDLQREAATLQARVEELKAFEREYRTRLRSYLENQLHELDHLPEASPSMNNRVAVAAGSQPAPPQPSAPAAAPPAPQSAPAAPPPPPPTAPPVAPPAQPAAPSSPPPLSSVPRPANPFGPPTGPPSGPPAGPPSGPPAQP